MNVTFNCLQQVKGYLLLLFMFRGIKMCNFSEACAHYHIFTECLNY